MSIPITCEVNNLMSTEALAEGCRKVLESTTGHPHVVEKSCSDAAGTFCGYKVKLDDVIKPDANCRLNTFYVDERKAQACASHLKAKLECRLDYSQVNGDENRFNGALWLCEVVQR